MAETIAGIIALAVLAACVIAMMRSQEAQNERCYMDRLNEDVASLNHCPGESPSKCMDCRYYKSE